MLFKLIVLFAVIPLVELALLIKIGEWAGIVFTVVLVGITGVLGVSLARDQGFKVVNRIKRNINQGQLPADDLLGGLLILAGGLFLLTPGLLTDITGFALVIPFTRTFFVKIVKSKLSGYIKTNVHTSQFGFYTGTSSNRSDSRTEKNNKEDVIDVNFTESEVSEEQDKNSDRKNNR